MNLMILKLINKYLLEPMIHRQKKYIDRLDSGNKISRKDSNHIKKDIKKITILFNIERIISYLMFKSILVYVCGIILIYIFTDTSSQFVVNLIWLVLLIVTDIRKDLISISMRLIIYPITFTFLILYIIFSIISYLNIDLYSNYTKVIIYFTLLGAIPIISLYEYLFGSIKNENINRLRVALEFNNFLYLTVASLTLLYLSFNNNLDTIFPQVMLSKLETSEITLKEFLINSTNLLSFPFIVSNALLKWLLEFKTLKVDSDVDN